MEREKETAAANKRRIRRNFQRNRLYNPREASHARTCRKRRRSNCGRREPQKSAGTVDNKKKKEISQIDRITCWSGVQIAPGPPLACYDASLTKLLCILFGGAVFPGL